LKYRGVEYAVVQGIERGLWKWSASDPPATAAVVRPLPPPIMVSTPGKWQVGFGAVEGVVVMGNEQTRWAAVIAAEKAIDRATGPSLQPDWWTAWNEYFRGCQKHYYLRPL